MSKTALIVRVRTLPGKREAHRRVWEKHLKPNIAASPATEAYSYCYDDNDPDVICVYQQYADRSAAQEFVKAPWYAAYIEEVSPLIVGQAEVTAVTPAWTKGDAR